MVKALVVLSILVILALVSLPITTSAEKQEKIPDWVRKIFEWYLDDKISEDEVINTISFLIDKKIIRGPFNDAKNGINEQLFESKKNHLTVIENQKIYWKFYDSKRNFYSWNMPIEIYEKQIVRNEILNSFLFELPNGNITKVTDHTQFVEKSFVNVIDDLYNNSLNDEDFLYEVWYIVSRLTTYSFDIEEYPRYALETFTRGGGDCEDTTILIADMIRSSSQTKDWKLQMVYFDAYNPENPSTVNHVALSIDTGENTYIIESTGKTKKEVNMWSGIDINGWWKDVPN